MEYVGQDANIKYTTRMTANKI